MDESGDTADDARHDNPVDPDRIAMVVPTAMRPGSMRHRRAQRTILVVIGCAGALGALGRYAIGRLAPAPTGHFPWSTLWINLTGSLAIGFVVVLLTERFPRARIARPLIVTGFIGAYTTFSTYMVDTDTLFRAGDIATGVIYVLVSMSAGATAVFVGILLARFVIRLDQELNDRVSP